MKAFFDENKVTDYSAQQLKKNYSKEDTNEVWITYTRTTAKEELQVYDASFLVHS